MVKYKLLDKQKEFIEIPHEVIDITETNNINSIEKYNNLNKYTTDSNVTIDEIKQFRPWVAHMLLRQNNIQDRKYGGRYQF